MIRHKHNDFDHDEIVTAEFMKVENAEKHESPNRGAIAAGGRRPHDRLRITAGAMDLKTHRSICSDYQLENILRVTTQDSRQVQGI